MRAAWLILGLLLTSGPSAAKPSRPAGGAGAPAGPYCSGEYADDFAALIPRARAFEDQQRPYTFCIRSSAVYECPFYAGDGNLRRTRKSVTAHGTGFAYRQHDGGTLLVTNDHVAEWPPVTDDEHPVEEVPPGCRRVSDKLKIVDSDSDEYERDDIPLTRVAADPQLDTVILKARVALPVMPWKIGRSAGLRERNVVSVRGFPLGVFKADNVGKVIAAYDHDEYKDWDHDDFVIDALLSPGNSGSPVFAVSCKTGEFELVGVYHAAYSRGSALNVVVAVDQLRDLMTALRRSPRPRAAEAQVLLDGRTRSRLSTLAGSALEPFFPFGRLAAAARVRADAALLFEIYSPDFPLEPQPILVLEDLPPGAGDAFGAPGRVWAGSRRGLKPYRISDLEGEERAQVLRILDAVRRDAVTTFALRASQDEAGSKEKFQHAVRLERALRKAVASRRDLTQLAEELAERLGPDAPEPAASLADVLAPLAPSPPAQPGGSGTAGAPPREGRTAQP